MKKLVQKIKQLSKQKKGFTLLETLVAVFILTLALTGPIYIATLAIRSSVESRDNISAYYLAEEGIEIIRNFRDTNSFKTQSNNWLGSPMGGIRNCIVTPGNGVDRLCSMIISAEGEYIFSTCDILGCPPLTFNPQALVTYGSTFEGETGTILSKFTREFYLEEVQLDQEIAVHMIVKWNDKGRARKFEIVERLFKQDYERYYSEK